MATTSCALYKFDLYGKVAKRKPSSQEDNINSHFCTLLKPNNSKSKTRIKPFDIYAKHHSGNLALNINLGTPFPHLNLAVEASCCGHVFLQHRQAAIVRGKMF
ncbi:hypothetical protein ILYODFUR_030310 [Ilyodon furcidens]|uniref:Uncharacterized protein n=1 Tax=Ilyodon furcidens TaxID=33524 RepID=A0ABV0TF95_9TELE